MVRVPCPKCRQYFFIPEARSFISCQQCGAFFSPKYGLDKRAEPRVAKRITFSFSIEGQAYKAATSDVSAKGVGIQIFGKPPLPRRMLLTLPIQKPSIPAKIIWVKRLSDQSVAGLEKV